MMKRDNKSSCSFNSVILALNAENVFAIRWILGYLRNGLPVMVISPYDLRKNPHFYILKDKILQRSDSLKEILQISSQYGYLSRFIIIRYLKAFIYLFCEIKRNRDKIIHAHNLSHFALLGLIINPRTLIISPYGSDVYSISWKRKLLLKLLLRRADLINPQSRFMAKHLRQVYRVPNRKMITIHTGVDIERWKRPSTSILKSIKKSMGIPEGSIVFLSYRNFKPIYQIHLLPNIHFRLLKENIPAFFIYVTNTYDKTHYIKKIEEMIERNNLSQRTKLIVKKMKAEELAKLLYISDYFFSIPKWDQVAATVQEGMYCECIPILSDLKVYKEVVNADRAVIIPSGSLHLMVGNIIKAVELDRHSNEEIKRTNRNIILNHFNMEKNVNLLIEKIIYVRSKSN